MGEAVERLFLPLVKKTIPEIVDMHLPVEGIFHNLMIVSIDKRYPGSCAQDDARDLGHGPDDVHQGRSWSWTRTWTCAMRAEVLWRALTAIDPERDVEFVARPRRRARLCLPPAVLRQQDGDRRDPQVEGRGLRAALARRDRHERGREGARSTRSGRPSGSAWPAGAEAALRRPAGRMLEFPRPGYEESSSSIPTPRRATLCAGRSPRRAAGPGFAEAAEAGGAPDRVFEPDVVIAALDAPDGEPANSWTGRGRRIAAGSCTRWSTGGAENGRARDGLRRARLLLAAGLGRPRRPLHAAPPDRRLPGREGGRGDAPAPGPRRSSRMLLPGRSPRGSPRSRRSDASRGVERLGARDGRGRDREGRRGASAAPAFRARRRTLRLHLRRGMARARRAPDGGRNALRARRRDDVDGVPGGACSPRSRGRAADAVRARASTRIRARRMEAGSAVPVAGRGPADESSTSAAARARGRHGAPGPAFLEENRSPACRSTLEAIDALLGARLAGQRPGAQGSRAPRGAPVRGPAIGPTVVPSVLGRPLAAARARAARSRPSSGSPSAIRSPTSSAG